MNLIYNYFKATRFSGDQMLSTDVVAMLLGPSFTFNASHQFVNDITGEVSGANYQRKALTGKSVSFSNITNTAVFSADPPAWPALDVGLISACVLYLKHNSDVDSPLIAALGISPAHPSQGGLFTVKWDPNGILRLS